MGCGLSTQRTRVSPVKNSVAELRDAPENAPERHSLRQPFTEHLPQQTSTHHSLLCTTSQQPSAASNTTATVPRPNIFIKGLAKRSRGRSTSQPSGSKLPRRETGLPDRDPYKGGNGPQQFVTEINSNSQCHISSSPCSFPTTLSTLHTGPHHLHNSTTRSPLQVSGTDSQVEFFAMLDKKIEAGPDYCETSSA